MKLEQLALLQFHHGPKARIWGGKRIAQWLGGDAGRGPIGEDWLVSDHPEHESVVAQGPLTGMTLRALVLDTPELLLGSRPRLTPQGRFPLLLKLLYAGAPLSVQVHPDDAAAARLGEPDVGKTEMWHVLDAAPESELVCGLRPGVTREVFGKALAAGTVLDVLERFPAAPGTTVFVPAGTVHAIGAGIVLAEIQQNSDITYRLHDYGRTDALGQPRALHLDKGLEVTQFDAPHAGANTPLEYLFEGAVCAILGACRYFAGRRIRFNGGLDVPAGDTFHLLLPLDGSGEVQAAGLSAPLTPFEPVFVAGGNTSFRLLGAATVLDYFVPNLAEDIVQPLRAAGHTDGEIVRLGGSMGHSDLTTAL